MVILIDNYDSFVYNLARYVSELGFDCSVYRNDEITVDQIKHLNPSHIIISPGPCTPNEAGISLELIAAVKSSIPLLGVCLGHQAIGQVFGGNVVRAAHPMHGKASLVIHNEQDIFQNLPTPLKVARYHSLIVENKNLPEDLIITSLSEEKEIMGLRHRKYNIFGVQFHPESVLTEHGYDLLANFLSIENNKADGLCNTTKIATTA